ncbi:acylneuraminate cytidylyltransferase family protein [Desulfosporosinus nitroreducens]|uniref:acylneuraminate cytidylyltransferase family protein n=1 Tax=Desulfosporosinus nitroreducens TaxID=2018668 RepID=UPI00207CFCD6|nr:acylneuraminate cytidylyltransferase family protein [Desulfosporosinus nitroreducens]MCO1601323.1 acylneuraminate cytidylyltransferase family protein [Desulfosporosinus nitroreducens]
MNLLFTVCGRAGSKGLKNKNIKMFLGFPLPYYTLSAIDLFINNHGDEYDNIVVAVNTDSAELIDLLKQTTVIFKTIGRKPEHAIDNASKVAVIKDTLLLCQKESGKTFDIVADLDITSPLRTLEDVELAIIALKQNLQADLSFSVTNSRRNPYFNMVKEQGGYYERVIKSNYNARQEAPAIYDMNASIYAYRNRFLSAESTKGVFDGKAVIHIMKDTAVLDIDSEEDFMLMKVIAQYFYDNNQKYADIRDNVRNIMLK